MVVLLFRRAARRGHSCPWDGARATFSTPDTATIQDTRQLPQQALARYHLTGAASVRELFRTGTGTAGLTRWVGPSGALCQSSPTGVHDATNSSADHSIRMTPDPNRPLLLSS